MKCISTGAPNCSQARAKPGEAQPQNQPPSRANNAPQSRFAAFSLTYFLLSFLLLGCSPASKEKLTVGMELAYPPFEMTDTQNCPAGVSADLARALAVSLGTDVDIQYLPFDGVTAALNSDGIAL